MNLELNGKFLPVLKENKMKYQLYPFKQEIT